ncbi:MAG TPA: hypothetical protein PLA43_07180 [Bryobacteraceae bacterium]|nr:hypothetical protein [Bryobacteraceae bacterium]HOL70096.1 hypothetical protein [Bryobacteraceae bacterium]HOQ43834.1 hypothetical protein [Bryobacteraceae bacterium]HPQ14708.1 hypothetical protein [Bryobacteraceae bacterium]HPU71723.1 hypothetical protein [Bryobacteraceae bacterium]
MRKRLFIASALAALVFLAAAQQSKADRSLKVKLNYTGSGNVDEKHKMFVFLFDSPEFVHGDAPPLAAETATAKDQTVTFSSLSVPTVYVVVAFDPNGTYDGVSGPPPSGSSVAMYSKEAGKPAPVNLEAGKTAQIELAFDDSYKMP